MRFFASGGAEANESAFKTARFYWKRHGKPGKVKLNKQYEMKRGDAYMYDVGQFHSPHRSGPTKLIRIEGQNLDFVKRDRYEAVEGAAAAE